MSRAGIEDRPKDQRHRLIRAVVEAIAEREVKMPFSIYFSWSPYLRDDDGGRVNPNKDLLPYM